MTRRIRAFISRVRKSGDTKPFTADDLATSVRQLADCIDRVANARQPSGQA
jgi:hypothetical protein